MPKQRWPEELARRCEQVGWTVSINGSGHYQARDENDNVLLTWSMTTASSSGYRNALSHAKRAGLFEREQELKRQRVEERRKQLAQEREHADNLIATINEANQSLNTTLGAAFSDAVQQMNTTLGAAFAVQQKNDQESDDDDMKKEKAMQPGSLGYVDGCAVVERARAKMPHPKSKIPLETDIADEVLLDDGRVVYVCTFPDCEYFAAKPLSIRAHRRVHSDKSPQVKNVDTSVPSVPALSGDVTDTLDIKDMSLEELKERVDRILKNADHLAQMATAQRNAVHAIMNRLVELANTVDDDVIQKANRYDQLKNLLDT